MNICIHEILYIPLLEIICDLPFFMVKLKHNHIFFLSYYYFTIV